MLNKYPLWKNLLILSLVALGLLYASPNLFPEDYAVQISHESSTMTAQQLQRITTILESENIDYFGAALKGRNALVRVADSVVQLKAKDTLRRRLGQGYIVALNLAPTTPQWLLSLNASPMTLGLDLRGGVHFLMEVDINTAIKKRLEDSIGVIKSNLRKAKLRYRSVVVIDDSTIEAKFDSAQVRDKTRSEIRSEFPHYVQNAFTRDGAYYLALNMSEQKIEEIRSYAIKQNLGTVRKRVNELGVSEPLVQSQGGNRIIIELPGVQDTAQAKKILGKVATLEFRLEADIDASISSLDKFPYAGRIQTIEKKVIVGGARVVHAQSGFDENGMPKVNVTLDAQGGKLMHRVTRKNVGVRMAILLIETKIREFDSFGNQLPKPQQYETKRVISLATIQSALGSNFQITGLETQEANDLSLLIRSGALAAPMYFVEERTVGPSLGADNIAQGFKSLEIGFALVLIFMLVYYRLFGLIANIALTVNLVLLFAVMSILSATLTLPGIAGMVLTVGMAVDANVLIFSRIREELKAGQSPQMAINAGFDRAFTTILDANLTTLLVALVLYAIGTGAIKGFAITLSIGIVTSMFTAIMGTRAIINLIYGGRTVKRLSIGV